MRQPRHSDGWNHTTMGQSQQESRGKQWATRSSVHLFIHTAHSFAYSALLTLLLRTTALICSPACSLTSSQPHGKDGFVYKMNVSLSYSLNPMCTGENDNEEKMLREKEKADTQKMKERGEKGVNTAKVIQNGVEKQIGKNVCKERRRHRENEREKKIEARKK